MRLVVKAPERRKPVKRISLEDVLEGAIERGDLNTVKNAINRGAKVTMMKGGLSAYERAIQRHGFSSKIVDEIGKARDKENQGQGRR
jgi:ethanolamine ammonia-lyase large subunit